MLCTYLEYSKCAFYPLSTSLWQVCAPTVILYDTTLDFWLPKTSRCISGSVGSGGAEGGIVVVAKLLWIDSYSIEAKQKSNQKQTNNGTEKNRIEGWIG